MKQWMCNLLPKPGFVTKQAHFYVSDTLQSTFYMDLIFHFFVGYIPCAFSKKQYILFGYYDSCRFHLCILSVFPFDISIALSDYNTVEYEN